MFFIFNDSKFTIISQPCDKVYSSEDYNDLQRKAGQTIANICKCHYVFWLTSSVLSPTPVGGGQPAPRPVCKYKTDIGGKDFNDCMMSNSFDGKHDSTTKAPSIGNSVLSDGNLQTPRVRIGNQPDEVTYPVTDENGFKVPPLMLQGGNQQPRELAEKDALPAANNNVRIDPRRQSDSDETPHLSSDNSFPTPGAPPLPFNDIAPPIWTKETRIENNRVETSPLPPKSDDQRNDNGSTNNEENLPYPVPKMGSMDAPPMPPALLRMLMSGLLPVDSKKESVAPPTPDMRTPPLPNGVQLP